MLYILSTVILLHLAFSIVMYCELSEARELIAKYKELMAVPVINNELEGFKAQADMLRAKMEYAKSLGLEFGQINSPRILDAKKSNSLKQ